MRRRDGLDRGFLGLCPAAVVPCRGHFDIADGVGQFVAQHGGLCLGVVLPDALDLVVRRFQTRGRDDHQVRIGPLFDVGNVPAFLVEEVRGDIQRHQGADDGTAFLQRLFLHHAQQGKRHGTDVVDAPLPAAARADLGRHLREGGAQALARHFHQPEAGDAPHLDACAVHFQCFAQAVLDRALIPRARHVDEVDDDQSADVAQAQLAADFLRRFEVRVERRLLDVGAARRARRVDVDRDQCFGGIDHERAAGGQVHLVLERGFDLALDLVPAEQGGVVGIELHPVPVTGHHLLDELRGFGERLLAVDEHLTDVLAQVIPNGPQDDVVLLIDQRGSLLLAAGGLDGLPQLEEIVEVPLQFLGAAPDPGRADDDPHAVGNLETAQGIAKLFALLAFYPPRDAPGARIVGHEDHVPSGKAQEGGERGPLVAPLLLVHLDEELLAGRDEVADGNPAAVAFRLGGLLRLDEQLPGDLLRGQKAVPLGAELDEGGAEARLYAGYLRLIDVPLLLFPPVTLDIEVIQALSVHESDAHLFGLRRVDEHAFHSAVIPWSRRETRSSPKVSSESRSGWAPPATSLPRGPVRAGGRGRVRRDRAFRPVVLLPPMSGASRLFAGRRLRRDSLACVSAGYPRCGAGGTSTAATAQPAGWGAPGAPGCAYSFGDSRARLLPSIVV